MKPMAHRILTGFVLAGLMAASLPAMAQDFSPDQLAAARDVIAATHMGDQYDIILPSLAEQAKAQFISQDPGNAKVIEDVVNTVALNLAKRRPELDLQVQQAWAARFTVDEMKQIAAFYTSPLGVKLGQYQPSIMKDSFTAVRAWQDALSADLIQKSRAELEKRATAAK